MGVKLSDLHQAMQRYKTFTDVCAQAATADFSAARMKLGIRNAKLFTSTADRLGVLANTLKANFIDAGDGTPLPPELLEVSHARQEAAFADNDLRPIRYLHIALLAARAVGKITVRGYVDTEGDATGFLVAPGLLLTNHHVLPSEDFAATSYVAFDMEDGLDGKPKTPKLFDLLPTQLYIADKDLDYCFVAVSPTTAEGEALAQFGYLRLFEQTGKLDPNRRQAANIVQHPLGQGKKVALRDNYFAEAPNQWDGAERLHSLYYGTDTLKGSSGSPVCTDEWYVVALHRGGVPKLAEVEGRWVVLRQDGTPAREGDATSSIAYVTNEGTRISSLYASLRQLSNGATALAAHAQAALQQISAVSQNPRLGPVDRSTAPLVAPAPLAAELFASEEALVRRKPDLFEGAQGYRPEFLGEGCRVELPALSHEVLKEVASLRAGGGHELKYQNYSVVMHARRRTAVYAAGNVDGSLLWKNVMGATPMPKRPAWTFDPRLDEQYQPDDAIFGNAMQRGHLFKREDAVQGADAAALQHADLHSFVITNATPMIGNFNNVEWGDLEDIVSRQLAAGQRASYFAGPIFDVEDKFFNEYKAGVPAADRYTGMRVPVKFWKIVVWAEAGAPRAAGFVLDQSDELRRHGPIIEELSFGKYRQTAIVQIEQRTGLTFAGLAQVDTYPGG
ncbi:DNA/RNA non-specific endonuclease [Pseudomonas entomophila]|uniref:DNA/RNA non-specific endonuclease n=1 Tax=Pseudomonas entomophila TaxID=312306 RepID=UPI0023D8B32B|nr:DNA/RNA non-specific endonuclease [Pseudomonas entomophila]MDF0732753.1 DNA/RNA non-specific endonuclease [Pseudomonas entomophila]